MKFEIKKRFEKEDISYDVEKCYEIFKIDNKKYYLDIIKKSESTFYHIKDSLFYLEDFLSIFYKINKRNEIQFGKTVLSDISEEISKYIIFLEKNDNGDIDFLIKVIFENKETFSFKGYFIDEYKEEFLVLQREKEEVEKKEALSQKRAIIRKKLLYLYKKLDIKEIKYDDFFISYYDLKNWDTWYGFSYEADSDYYDYDTYTRYCPLYILDSLIEDIMEHGTDEYEYSEYACIYFN